MTAVVQRSFSSGEISPSLYARTDVQKFASALRTCRNFQVQRHGGAANRPGTQFIGEVKDSNNTARLMKFVFNSDQTYILEFGDQYIRFYRLGGQLVVSGVAAWSAATNYVVGDLVVEASVNYYCILAHTNQQPPNATYWYPLTGVIYEIPTPYLEADLPFLRYVQSGDVITITHPGYAVRELSRTGHTAWTLTAVDFSPSILAPASPSATPGGAGALVYRYELTAIQAESYEESTPTASFSCNCVTPTVAAPNALTWTASAGAVEYNVYRETFIGSGIYGFIGKAASNSFNDPNIAPDGDITPPIVRDPFSGAGNFPVASGYYQQRQVFGGSDDDPEQTHASRSGNFNNFTVSSPTRDDDAVSWTIAAAKVQAVRHILGLTKLIIFTAEGEWAILGGPDGVLRPGEVNPVLQSENGSGELPPIVVNKSAIYLQARGSVVRDLSYSLEEDGYSGDDLTVFATHLFQFNSLMDWDFQKTPNSIIWAIRDDGILLGLTYLKEHKVLGWHRHDTKNGFFENVCVVPEGDEDGVYFIILRSIGGVPKRYIERLASRNFRDIIDAYFVDCGISYDGWNAGATTMTLTGGVDWLHTETLTMTASAAFFVAGDVGNTIVLYSYIDPVTGEEKATVQDSVICTITAFTSTTEVDVRSNKTVPIWARGVAGTDWSKGIDVLGGFDHLEGQTISIFADGHVETPMTVTGGQVVLPTPRSLIFGGLSITADLETLDIDTADDVPLTDKYKNVQAVDMVVESSRGILVGPDVDHLEIAKQRELEDMGEPVQPLTGQITVNIESNWNSSGRVFVRQVDPLPLAILSIVPSGMIPLKGR
jgi:hypothetical protein